MTRSLTVWWDSEVVGSLALDRHCAMRFAYAPRWLTDDSAPPLSFSLPKRQTSFSTRECLPFFEGLLPEGAQRDAVAAALGVSPGNTFELLAELGAEVAGAIALWPEGEAPPSGSATDPPEPLSDEALVRLLDTIRTRPFLAARRGSLRLSLAGAQSKMPVIAIDGAVALPSPGRPSTHILKPSSARFPAITENEAFAMRLATRMGLSVAPVQPGVVANRSFLLVERYDRRGGGDGTIKRLHQEDFCQALGVPPARKYASEGGPTFARCFELVRRVCTRPAREVLKLLDAAILQMLLGNADAHGKNYSLLARPDGSGSFAVPRKRLGRLLRKNSSRRGLTRKRWPNAPGELREGRGGWRGVCDSSRGIRNQKLRPRIGEWRTADLDLDIILVFRRKPVIMCL